MRLWSHQSILAPKRGAITSRATVAVVLCTVVAISIIGTYSNIVVGRDDADADSVFLQTSQSVLPETSDTDLTASLKGAPAVSHGVVALTAGLSVSPRREPAGSVATPSRGSHVEASEAEPTQAHSPSAKYGGKPSSPKSTQSTRTYRNPRQQARDGGWYADSWHPDRWNDFWGYRRRQL
jgi:hypothetical protein